MRKFLKILLTGLRSVVVLKSLLTTAQQELKEKPESAYNGTIIEFSNGSNALVYQGDRDDGIVIVTVDGDPWPIKYTTRTLARKSIVALHYPHEPLWATRMQHMLRVGFDPPPGS